MVDVDRHAEATERIRAFVESLDAPVGRPGPGRWSVHLEAAGHPLHVDLTIHAGRLRVRAAVLPAGLIDPHQLLYWNGQAPFVAFAENAQGEVFVGGELPLEGLATDTLDRFLGLTLTSAARARDVAITGA